MPRVVFANHKGGVGKSTACREIGIYTASLGYMVLFIDCDAQSNLTKSLTDEAGPGLYEALTECKVSLKELDKNLYMLAADFRLTMLEKSLIGEIDCYLKLKELLESSEFNGFDFIFLDTPPSLGVMTINALTAARHIIIPMRPAFYSLQGTNDLMSTISKVRKTLNPDLSLLGVIINGFKSIPVITRQIKDEIHEAFGDKVFKTVISSSIKLQEVIVSKKGVIHHKKLGKSRAKQEVSLIGDEILSRLGVPEREG